MRSQCFQVISVAIPVLLLWRSLTNNSENERESQALFTRLGPARLHIPPQVRDREGLPDSHLTCMPDVLQAPTSDFPAFFQYAGSEQVETAGKAYDELLDQHLARHNVVVVKGLPIDSVESFSQVMHATNMTLVDYIGGVTTRPILAPKVTDASAEPSYISMEPHCDNPYWLTPPRRLLLYAKTPASSGGQAMLTDARDTLRRLRQDHLQELEELQRRSVRYLHFFPDRTHPSAGLSIPSWQESIARECFGKTDSCNETDAAERALRKGGFDFEWVSGGLRRSEVANPVQLHPVTGEATWENMLSAMHCSVFDNHPEFPEFHRPVEARTESCKMRGAMPFHTTFADGGEIPVPTLNAVRCAQMASSVSFELEEGDVLAVDNYHAMHGRFSFEGNRQLYLIMAGAPSS